MRKDSGSLDGPFENVAGFQKSLIEWFRTNGRDLPWRLDPTGWSILVSEIMLQQTTVSSIVKNRRYEKFLKTFPTPRDLAGASEAEILRAWEGLGYYNRIRNLQKAAQVVEEQFKGEVPADSAALLKLPGLGRYTAGAISSFAFDRAEPIVESNIARVLARLFNYTDEIDTGAGQKFLWEMAEALLDHSQPRKFNSALMELGQMVCSPGKPGCQECPVKKFCLCPDPESLPRKKARRKFIDVEEHAFFQINDGRILLSPGRDSRRQGFWILPLREPEEVAHLEAESTHRYTITHHRVRVSLYREIPPTHRSDEEYFKLDEIENLPIASPIRKIIKSKLG